MANLWRKQVAMWFPMMRLMAVGTLIWVFVGAEEVGIAEVGTDGMGKLICEDGSKEELKVCIYGWVVKADKAMEGIRNDAIGFIFFGETFDGGAGYSWMWVTVEPLDHVRMLAVEMLAAAAAGGSHVMLYASTLDEGE